MLDRLVELVGGEDLLDALRELRDPEIDELLALRAEEPRPLLVEVEDVEPALAGHEGDERHDLRDVRHGDAFRERRRRPERAQALLGHVGREAVAAFRPGARVVQERPGRLEEPPDVRGPQVARGEHPLGLADQVAEADRILFPLRACRVERHQDRDVGAAGAFDEGLEVSAPE